MRSGWMMVAVLALARPAAFAEAPGQKAKHGDLAKPIERLLDFSAEPSPKAFKTIEHAYRALPAATRKQPTVQYAYVVAMIRQKRYQEASRVLQELVDEHAAGMTVWRAKIWIELELDERVRAMTDLEELSSHAAGHQETAAERSNDKDSAEFFGAVCGFLVGPWSHKVPDDDAKTIEDRLRAVFDDENRKAFDEAKAKLVEQYEKLYQEHEGRVQSELAAKTKQLDDAKNDVGRKAQDLGKKQQALKDNHAKRDAEKKTKVADIEAQLKKIDQQRQALLVQIAPLEAQRAALLAQLAPQMMFPLLSPHLKGQIIRFNIQADMATGGRYNLYSNNRRIRMMLAPLVAKLTALEGQVTSLNQQELELRGEGFMAEMKHQSELGKLANQEQELDKTIKRVKYDAQRLQVKTAAVSPRLRTEAAQLTKIATYAPFPFEREKEHLLAHPNGALETDQNPVPADQ